MSSVETAISTHSSHGQQNTTTSAAAIISSLSTLLLYDRQTDICVGVPIDPAGVFEKIGKKGDLQMVQWLLAQNRLPFPFTRSLLGGAAYGGHIDILKWLIANGCDVDARIYDYAATGGQLEVLKWARANGCDTNAYTCTVAAEGGHLEVLKWARANGCPWDEDICHIAAGSGHLEVLKWAVSNGCEWFEDECRTAAMVEGHAAVMEWIEEWVEENEER